MSAPVCSRRVAAGITPPPGFLAHQLVWWGATDWCEFEVRGALRESRDVCAAHHVAPDTVLAVARAMAGFADSRTGRDCRPTNERLVAVARVSLSTVQRARRVLKALGLVVEVTAGRSVMTLAERLQAWDRGSKHRRIAAEFALCSRRDRRLRAVDNRAADLQVVDRDTPPVGEVVRTSATESTGFLQREDATRKAAPRPAHTEKSRARAVAPVDLAPRRLAEAVRRRVDWLEGVPARRMTPLLSRFARAGWTARDVDLAVRDSMAARGWRRVPALKQPAAYLAALLRDVDPADRPSVLDDAYTAAMAAAAAEKRAGERRWAAALRTSCPHGVPAGDVRHPLQGHLPCPSCRQAPPPPRLG